MNGTGTARDLLTNRFVTGYADQRLSDLSARLMESPADYCAILEARTQRFLGLLAFRDVVLQPAVHQRILADLLPLHPHPTVSATTPVAEVLDRIRRTGTGPLAVVAASGELIGVISPESLSSWLLDDERERRLELEAFLAERRALADFLEKKIEERTHALQTTFEQLNRFSLSLSHDLRGPLRSLRAYAELLQDGEEGPLPEPLKQRLARIQALATKLEQFADEFLHQSRQAAGRTETTNYSVDLNEVYDDALAFHHALVNERGAVIKKRAPLHAVHGRYVLALQILGNLLTNAIRSAPAPRVPEVEVWTEANDTSVTLFVKDNGLGISEEEQKRIFLPFVSGSASSGGVGLGLTLIHRAAADLEGHVSFDSVLHSGSTFRVSLRRAG